MTASPLGHVLLGVWIAATFLVLAWEMTETQRGVPSSALLQRTLNPTLADPRPANLRYTWSEPLRPATPSVRPLQTIGRAPQTLRLVVSNPPRTGVTPRSAA